MKHPVARALPIVACVALSLLGAGGIRAAGSVLVVDVDEPFVIEQQEFGAGTLTFRGLADLSPAIAVEEVRVDGVTLGRVALRRTRPEVSWGHNAAVFARDTRGRLVLVGVARRSGPRAGSYRLASAAALPAEIVIAAR